MSTPIAKVPTLGSVAPDVVIGSKEENLKLSSLRGDPAVVVFLGDHWDPAQSQLLEACRQVLESISITGNLVSVSVGTRLCELDFESQRTIQFPIAGNLGAEGAAAFGVTGKKAVFVIDSTGKISWKYVSDGGGRPDFDELAKAVDKARRRPQISRRDLIAIGIAASICLVLPGVSHASAIAPLSPTSVKVRTTGLNVNGKTYSLNIDGGLTLLDALREKIGLTGTKKGCDHGQCGACTVHMDGRRVNSCLILAAQAEGSHITTIEGLATNGQLSPIQQAFITHDGLQCGFCTSGQIMSAVSCIKEGHASSEVEVKEWMSGNICRCGAYPGICAAVQEAKNAI